MRTLVQKVKIKLGLFFSKYIPSYTWSYFFGNNSSAADLQKIYPELKVSFPTSLCKIMNEEKSDKGSGWHNYTKVYHQIFKGLKVENIFELGIGSVDPSVTSNMGKNGTPGASLRGWSRYFDSAIVYAADIDAKTLITEERIKSYVCDQTNSQSIKKLWSNADIPASFDVMIDDGLHEFLANVTFFEHSIYKLRKGGIYVVEDILGPELGLWYQKIGEEYKAKYPDFVFRICCIPNVKNACDNNLLIVYT